MIIAIFLALLVLLMFMWPVKTETGFDEKGEAIKIYRDEVAFIDKQYQTGLIDAQDKAKLLEELDVKTTSAIARIEKKQFAPRLRYTPVFAVALVITLSLAIYFVYLQNSQIKRWHDFKQVHQAQVTEGLFDGDVIAAFLNKNPSLASHYCFTMQQTLLANYHANADALANLANCHLIVGYPQLARQAISRGLGEQPEHAALNFLSAEMAFVENNQLSSDDLDRLFITIRAEPKHKGALRLLGINSLNLGQYAQAQFFFDNLREVETDPQILALLDDIDETIAARQAAEAAAGEPQPVTPQSAPQTSPQATKQLQPNEASLHLAIAVSPTLIASQPETLTWPKSVFVVVKSVDGALINASKYIMQDANQALVVTISDDMPQAMQRQSLADFEQVTVTARVSLDDQPIAASGDLTSGAIPIPVLKNTEGPARAPYRLVIDRTVP
ncbi:c-type cytochrome biogenesis protein CcmI [Ostreibacterium oceani]|uniref:C-type cytochrome biogenesis protein CcmI n=1 Tax=Ostreibacterium oceani TaxID=2654998 RepID=A0A6N7ET58_9GAMM|nr:c-type cytochrome biogenesis protein CcmI [Ostreibacterium oceani]MPV86024.1 c-type cytochrome biogenesis protein CcmI [Ostreibacterium oceani]